MPQQLRVTGDLVDYRRIAHMLTQDAGLVPDGRTGDSRGSAQGGRKSR